MLLLIRATECKPEHWVLVVRGLFSLLAYMFLAVLLVLRMRKKSQEQLEYNQDMDKVRELHATFEFMLRTQRVTMPGLLKQAQELLDKWKQDDDI